jgi:hypothetical protein
VDVCPIALNNFFIWAVFYGTIFFFNSRVPQLMGLLRIVTILSTCGIHNSFLIYDNSKRILSTLFFFLYYSHGCPMSSDFPSEMVSCLLITVNDFTPKIIMKSKTNGSTNVLIILNYIT